MKRIIHSIYILVALLVLPLSATAQADGLKTIDGKPAKIEDYTGKGKWTVVMFWASDCHVCNAEAHSYVDFHLAHADDDATVLGVSLDGKAKLADAKKFIKRHNVDFPNLIGEPLDVTTKYMELTGRPWIGTPTILLYDPKGILRAQEAGAVPTELIEAFMKQFNPETNKLQSKK